MTAKALTWVSGISLALNVTSALNLFKNLRRVRVIAAGFLLFAFSSFSLADEGNGSDTVYLSNEAFLEQHFDTVPKPKLLWLTGERKTIVTDILQHKPNYLRVRYWQNSTNPNQTVWILDEIGKHKPITTGIAVNDGELKSVRVLAFRESRGWEVKYPFFSDQFDGGKLDDDHQLTTAVDNITGATLSVRAVTKKARLALLFDRWIQAKNHASK